MAGGLFVIVFMILLFYGSVLFLRWVFMVDKIHKLLKDSHDTQKKLLEELGDNKFLKEIASESSEQRRERWRKEDEERIAKLELEEDI